MKYNVPREVEKCTSTKAAQKDSSMVYAYNMMYNIYNIMWLTMSDAHIFSFIFYHKEFINIFRLFLFILLLKMNTSKAVQQQVAKTKTIPNFFKPSTPKICDVLSDVLREPIMGKIYRTVRGQVKNHSALTKQNKCWSVTALIADHTSSVEVCFNSEVCEIKWLSKTTSAFYYLS